MSGSFIGGGSTPFPSYRRIMVFIDGENLVFNYQALIKSGYTPKSDVKFSQDTYVWHPETIKGYRNEVLRATYYTFCVGDDNRIKEVNNEINQMTFLKDPNSSLPNNLRPAVFRKDKQGRKTKGVDIQISVDILTNVFNNNLDTVLLITGDGDFLPIITEISRQGKQVYLSSFKSCLNEKLMIHVDKYISLESIYFDNIKS